MKAKKKNFKTLKTTLRFGKYKDKTIEEVLELNPSYIEWCIENVDDFVLDEEAEFALYECLDSIENYDGMGPDPEAGDR